MKVTLTKPVQHGDEEIRELDLREPEGGDVEVCGYPLIIGDGAATPVPAAVSKLISRLAGVPPSVVKRLSIRDYQACLGVVLGFFGE